MTADTATLTEAEQRFVSILAAQSPDIANVADLARRFAALIRERRGGDDLEEWLAQAERSPLWAFAKSLRQDLPAVSAALSLPWSTSPVEGQINRLKMLKRQMYGRAGFALLQRRLLAA
jgi:transposase